jgi:hypothetical protein
MWNGVVSAQDNNISIFDKGRSSHKTSGIRYYVSGSEWAISKLNTVLNLPNSQSGSSPSPGRTSSDQTSYDVANLVVLDIGNVGGGRIQGDTEQVELEGLFLSLGGGISAGFSVCGGVLGLHEVVNLPNLLPGLGTLLSCGVVVGRLILC